MGLMGTADLYKSADRRVKDGEKLTIEPEETGSRHFQSRSAEEEEEGSVWDRRFKKNGVLENGMTDT